MAPMCHFAVFSEDVAFAYHFMATCWPPTLQFYRLLVILAMPVKNYLKWRAIQLAIYSIVGG